MVGTVVDPSGRIIIGAHAVLRDSLNGAMREAVSDSHGGLAFNVLAPSTYSLTVESPGFKRYEREGIVLTTDERLALGEIPMRVGAVTETVTVVAQGAVVQSASGERSGLITAEQMDDMPLANREFSGLLALVPGVVTTVRGQTLGAGNNALLDVQGGRNSGNNITLDGQPITDLGNQWGFTAFVNMDAINEVRILVSNYQAEFGRRPGASVTAVTKSGSKQLHGSAYMYVRNEDFNANDFFNNRGGLAKPEYRYLQAGYTIGGPVFIPRFDHLRDKLFFFFSDEHLRAVTPEPINYEATPTPLERTGNFSQTVNANGTLQVITDPQNGGSPFPGNIIPASRIYAPFDAFLNLLPQQNETNIAVTGRTYNFQDQQSLPSPKHNEVVRIDYLATPKTTVYVRTNNWWENQAGWATSGGNSTWGWFPDIYLQQSHGLTVSVTRILSPTLIFDMPSGVVHAPVTNVAEYPSYWTTLNRVNSGATIPQWDPQNNPMDLVPNVNFGGNISHGIATAIASTFPSHQSATTITTNPSLTKTTGKHTSKLGMYAERAIYLQGRTGNYVGSFVFQRDSTNPNDANNSFANALLGNFESYTEATALAIQNITSNLFEWYAQDNWKVTRRLTLDFGVRFAWVQPYQNQYRAMAGFLPSTWVPGNAVELIQPVLVGKTRMAENPVTGQILPAADIGGIVPGVGNPLNGTIDAQTDPGEPSGLRPNAGLKVAPRFGFAYDPFGKSKTVIRGGFGSFYEMREQALAGFSVTSNPPLSRSPIVYDASVQTLLSAQGIAFPSTTSGFQPFTPLSRVMNFSFSVQQNIGFGTVLDVAYAGALGRHLVEYVNLNSVPFGSDFLAKNQDPTQPGKPLSENFLRPYLGYGDINYFEYAGNSSYHSLQVSANRRFIRVFQFGASYTWSKAMDYTDANYGGGYAVSNLVNPKIWNYGEAGFDRTNVLTINWVYNVPRVSRLWNHAGVRRALDDWKLSGIATFSSGAPVGVTFTDVVASDFSGSLSDLARVVVIGDPTPPRSQRTVKEYFNPNAFAPPTVGGIGDAAKYVVRAPGINNWDAALFKEFSLGSEKARLQIRAELYNVFNHPQFSTLNTAASFSATGAQISTTFGAVTATQANSFRRAQFSARIRF